MGTTTHRSRGQGQPCGLHAPAEPAPAADDIAHPPPQHPPPPHHPTQSAAEVHDQTAPLMTFPAAAAAVVLVVVDGRLFSPPWRLPWQLPAPKTLSQLQPHHHAPPRAPLHLDCRMDPCCCWSAEMCWTKRSCEAGLQDAAGCLHAASVE